MKPDALQDIRAQLVQLKALHDAGALDAAAYDTARSALERRLGELVLAGAVLPAAAAATPRPGTRLWGVVALFIGVVAVAGYAWTGSPAAVGAVASAPAPAAAAPTQQQLIEMVDKLAARLAANPDDAEGWAMLGRSYLVLEKMPEAAAAYEKALKLRPQDPTLMADYADALAAKNGRTLDGEPTELLQRALAIDPENLKALMLAGSAAFTRGDYAGAVGFWERVAPAAPTDHPWVQQAAQGIAEARRLGKLPEPAAAVSGSASAAAGPVARAAASAPTSGSPAPAAQAATAATAAATATAVSGTVALAPALQAQTSPDDTVFIYARAAEGPRMPLAILRKRVKDLPLDFVLDDSLAMAPEFKLSTASRVIVSARISKSGQAIPQPGDLEALSAPLPIGTSGIRLTISSAIK